jgi:hypothetical protein
VLLKLTDAFIDALVVANEVELIVIETGRRMKLNDPGSGRLKKTACDVEPEQLVV